MYICLIIKKQGKLQVDRYMLIYRLSYPVPVTAISPTKIFFLDIIHLTKILTVQDETALCNHRVRGLYLYP